MSGLASKAAARVLCSSFGTGVSTKIVLLPLGSANIYSIFMIMLLFARTRTSASIVRISCYCITTPVFIEYEAALFYSFSAENASPHYPFGYYST